METRGSMSFMRGSMVVFGVAVAAAASAVLSLNGGSVAAFSPSFHSAPRGLTFGCRNGIAGRVLATRPLLAGSATSTSDAEDDVVLFSSVDNDDDDFDDNFDDDGSVSVSNTNTNTSTNTNTNSASKSDGSKRNVWQNLHPKVKLRLIKEGQERAIANKKKREPASVKKARMQMYFEKAKAQKKRDNRVTRPLSLKSEDRVDLSSFAVDEWVNGTVISLTKFGAYVDIGSECDGLLHISQARSKWTDPFVERMRDVVAPGDVVDNLRISRLSPELKKFQLSMLPPEGGRATDPDDESTAEDITLEELDLDDELWGELDRVTDYGAYVNVGAEEFGFLHFMDHPDFGQTNEATGEPQHPSEFMAVGERVRVWVSDIDLDRRRIKLTGNRPATLPQLRREVRRY